MSPASLIHCDHPRCARRLRAPCCRTRWPASQRSEQHTAHLHPPTTFWSEPAHGLLRASSVGRVRGCCHAQTARPHPVRRRRRVRARSFLAVLWLGPSTLVRSALPAGTPHRPSHLPCPATGPLLPKLSNARPAGVDPSSRRDSPVRYQWRPRGSRANLRHPQLCAPATPVC